MHADRMIDINDAVGGLKPLETTGSKKVKISLINLGVIDEVIP